MDYYGIGQRIRKFRKANQLSQDELAEKVGISTTHMSHIETGNTKLSLPVFISIANALSVRTDELLHDIPELTKTPLKQEIIEILDTCSINDLQILTDILKALKISLEKNR